MSSVPILRSSYEHRRGRRAAHVRRNDLGLYNLIRPECESREEANRIESREGMLDYLEPSY